MRCPYCGASRIHRGIHRGRNCTPVWGVPPKVDTRLRKKKMKKGVQDEKKSVIREVEMGKSRLGSYTRKTLNISKSSHAIIGVSRCGFYKWFRSKTGQMNVIPDMDVRNPIESGMGFHSAGNALDGIWIKAFAQNWR